MALVHMMVALAPITWNSPVRLLMPVAPVMRPSSSRSSPVTNRRSINCTPSLSSAPRRCQQNSRPAAVRVHDAGEIEAAGRPAGVGAVLVAPEGHAHGFEIAQPVVGIHERLTHQFLVGDAVIAGDDLAQDAVDVVVGKGDDGPGVGKGGVAGAADHPGIDQRHARAARAVALGAERGEQAAGAGADHQDVRFGVEAVEFCAFQVHQGRGRFFTDGCTSTICSGQKISQLKQVMQCSRYLITGSRFVLPQARHQARRGRRLHVDDVGRADDVAHAAAGAFLHFDVFDHATPDPSTSLAAASCFF